MGRKKAATASRYHWKMQNGLQRMTFHPVFPKKPGAMCFAFYVWIIFDNSFFPQVMRRTITYICYFVNRVRRGCFNH